MYKTIVFLLLVFNYIIQKLSFSCSKKQESSDYPHTSENIYNYIINVFNEYDILKKKKKKYEHYF